MEKSLISALETFLKNRYILFFVLLFFSFTMSCRKDEAVPLLHPKDLVGTWELRYIKGVGTYPLNTGYEIAFTETRFEKFSSHNSVANGTYQLIKEKNLYTGNEIGYRLAYKFDEVANGYDTESKEYVMIVNGNLVLYTSLDEELYVKIH